MIAIKDVFDLRSLLMYCSEKLSWEIDEEYFDDIDELTYDFEAADLGLKDDAFAKVKSFKQLRPLSEDQPWGIFSVEFESKHLEISALRKILYRLVPNTHATEYKTWSHDRLLFLCFWGEESYRSVGFVAFEKQKDVAIPIIKTLYCEPKVEDRAYIENFEQRLLNLKWPQNISTDEWIEQWSKAFHTKHGQTIRDTKTLTEKLAQIALNISENMSQAVRIERDCGQITLLYHRFNSALNINLSMKEFIDMYSQTLVYGLFSARCMNPDVQPFTVQTAAMCVPKTNPLLRELLEECCSKNLGLDFDELEISDLVDLLNDVDIHNILEDFNRQTRLGKEDPVVYFYEGFLDIYEKDQKKRCGVYYTPMPAVDFMVRSVTFLLKTKFGCNEAFLDDGVSVLDPATGTGTFLRRIIFEIQDEFNHLRSDEKWSKYVSESLLRRLFGFEFMMAPYAVAHMKLAMTLKETGYDFQSSKRLQVYLANSLENTPEVPSPTSFEDPLVRESSYAELARKSKINVVIGNPPYHTDSVNKGEWIMSLMEDYKREPGTNQRLQERNPKVVNDDYVKFIRFAQDIIESQDKAVVAYIHPHSYMDNLTFRGMRWNLLHTFEEIYIVDLHGNVMSRETFDSDERDENIFDIQQGVCISFFVKKSNTSGKEMASVYYSELYGSKSSKYKKLSELAFEHIDWINITPTAPYYFLKPKDLTNATTYNQGISLAELFPVNIGGIKTHSDETLVSMIPFETQYNQPYSYRPFDQRFINYDLTKVERPRYEVMKNFIGHDNLGLVIDRQVVTDNWSHIQYVDSMIDNRLHYSRKGIPVVCPLFLYDDHGAPRANIDKKRLTQFSAKLNLQFVDGSESRPGCFNIIDVADYCYAILFSNIYRDTYKNLLSIDFPHVPAPTEDEMFISLAAKGKQLRKIHIQKNNLPNDLNINFVGTGSNEVTSPAYANNAIKINKTQRFENVSEALWDFCFGGYHGVQKWLKDRKHQVLSDSDIAHIISTLNMFDQTGVIMGEIDEIITRCGMLI